jgi:hypothetical protein
MTEKSSKELEREAEAARSRMTETAETLQRKLSPGELLDEIGTYLKNSDGPIALDNLKTQVRDNPLPLALIGVGLAWLFAGGGPKSETVASKFGASHHGPESLRPDVLAPSTTETGSEASSFGVPPGTLDTVGEHARSAGQALGDAGHRATSHIQSGGDSLQRMLSDTLDKEPLILGALGVAVGAAIGTMLPKSQAEAEVLAPYGNAARQGTMEAVNTGLKQTRDAVSEAVNDSANKQDGDRDRR